MPATFFKKLISILFLTAFSMPGWAQWQLNNDESSLYYVTNKAAAIAEVNTFSRLSGEISTGGTATLSIDLSSVSTAIEIRDQRMQEILFEVGQYPSATVSIDTSMTNFASLEIGEAARVNVNYTLSLHGMSNSLSTPLKIVKLADDKLEISSIQPIIINAGQFGLAQGVEALREVAGLPSINPNVVVSFSLVYDHSM
jgi:polyisoprenoid-binding protein YceI